MIICSKLLNASHFYYLQLYYNHIKLNTLPINVIEQFQFVEHVFYSHFMPFWQASACLVFVDALLRCQSLLSSALPPSTNQLDLCLEMRASFASAKFNLLQFPLVASISLPIPASAHFHVRCKTEFRSSNRCWGRWRCGSCQLLRLYYLLCTYIERS